MSSHRSSLSLVNWRMRENRTPGSVREGLAGGKLRAPGIGEWKANIRAQSSTTPAAANRKLALSAWVASIWLSSYPGGQANRVGRIC